MKNLILNWSTCYKNVGLSLGENDISNNFLILMATLEILQDKFHVVDITQFS